MRRLVLLVLVAFPALAHAGDDPPCDLGVRVLPRAGDTVPSNAKIWIASHAPWTFTLATAT